LALVVQVILEAEDGMRGDRARGHDRGDEREPVGRRRDLPIAQPGSRERSGRIEEAGGDLRRDPQARPGDLDGERREVLAFDDRKSVAAGEKMLPVVGGVELAPKMDVPAGAIAEPRDGESDRVQDVDVARGSNVGDS
jgi:hypothetical protein